jgi:hypothetical protein
MTTRFHKHDLLYRASTVRGLVYIVCTRRIVRENAPHQQLATVSQFGALFPDRLTVGRNITLTLTLNTGSSDSDQRGIQTGSRDSLVREFRRQFSS